MRKIVLLTIVATVTCLAWGYPKPSIVATAWELDFKFRDIRRITLDVPGQGRRTYWYMVYTVTNDTGRDVAFHPECTLVTDQLKAYSSEVGVHPAVIKAIKARYENTYPWLEHPREPVGKLLQGKDNARDTIAVWPDFAPKTSEFTIYVGGLSGEVTTVPNPMFVRGTSDPKKVPEKFVLRKTLYIQYALPTDPASRNRTDPARSGRPPIGWVMR